MKKKTIDCSKCYGTPCVCKELKEWKPVSTIYMWEEKENEMIPIGYIPEHPKHKRMWDNAVPLK